MKKIFFLIIPLALLFQGCEKYLDKIQASTGMTDVQVFSDYLNFRKFEDKMYANMMDPINDGDYGFIAACCDEGYDESDWETMPIVQTGDYIKAYSTAQALQFSTPWAAWASIRIANICLEKIPMLEGKATQDQINQIKGQAYFMRAWYYHEFLKRQGGLPYLEVALKGTDNFAIPRLEYYEMALKIAADCDMAAGLLPESWDIANMGRPTKGAAMAVKASTLLFGASPTNNASGDVTRWTAAATAAWDLIRYAETTGKFKLMPSKGTDQIKYKGPTGVDVTITYPSGFDSIFMYTPYNDEIIWEYYSRYNTSKYIPFTVNSLVSLNSIIQGYSPSQNIVDMFETTNGLKITDDPGYNPQNPYVNRDPRFYHSILFNREKWTSNAAIYLELYNGGRDRKSGSLKKFSYTGYIARKFWGKNVDRFSGANPPFTHSIFFRYAEILLMYAEAANEVGGPTYTLPGATMTAVQALDKVRARVNMPPTNAIYLANKDLFRERIKNERAIELYLEGKRYFDLSRWGDAHKLVHREIYGADFLANPAAPTGYDITRTPLPVYVLVFDMKHYHWPIPIKDAQMFFEVKQTPGW
jgi:starch-binding outer membrane protein, SusD/RagB family